MLLRPVIASGRGNDHYTSVCVESAASYCEVCSLFRANGQTLTSWQIEHAALGPDPKSPRLSNWGLYKTFLSGLTLLHLGSAARTAHLVDAARATSAMRKCQQVLQLYTRFLPNITGYKECFDELMASFERNRLEASTAAGRSSSAGTMDPRQMSSPNAPLRIGSGQTLPSQAGQTAPSHPLSHQRPPMAANPTAGVMWHPPLHAHSQHALNTSLGGVTGPGSQGVSDPFAQLHHNAAVSQVSAGSLDQTGQAGNAGQHALNYSFSGRPPIGSPDELPLGNGIREDFFSYVPPMLIHHDLFAYFLTGFYPRSVSTQRRTNPSQRSAKRSYGR